MHRIARIDLVGGLLLMAVGLFFALYGAQHYGIGELRRMGPGFFPVVLGVVLAVIGLVLVAASFLGSVDRIEGFAWRPFAFVLLGLASFAWLVDKFGMIPSTLVLTAIVALAERRFRPRRTALLAVSLAAIAVTVFTWGLGLPIPAVRWNV